MDKILETIKVEGTHFGGQIVGAILLWVVGKWLINLAVSLLGKGMQKQKVDQTLANYAVSSVTGLLNIVLIISILGAFGVQTATFAALFAALGLAIGTAWSGLLSNFAAGVFMVILRPFKVGDLIQAGGVLGTVVEIGPFATKINTLDNVLTIVGNSKILGDNIENFTHNPYRRVDLKKQFNHDVDVFDVMANLRERLATIDNVMADPAPVVEILEFNEYGALLAVRPFCHNDNYWQVYFDANRAVIEVCQSKGYSVPEKHLVVRNAG